MSEGVEIGQGCVIYTSLPYDPKFEELLDDPEFNIINNNNIKLEKIQAQVNKMREEGEIRL